MTFVKDNIVHAIVSYKTKMYVLSKPMGQSCPLLCGPRQVFIQCIQEKSKGWTPPTHTPPQGYCLILTSLHNNLSVAILSIEASRYFSVLTAKPIARGTGGHVVYQGTILLLLLFIEIVSHHVTLADLEFTRDLPASAFLC